MRTCISLLRGMNVGGKHRLPMIALKDIYRALGCLQVTTYIQSGNVILQATSSKEALACSLSQAIRGNFGYIVPVLVRAVAFFSNIVVQNPFTDCDPSTLYVTPCWVTGSLPSTNSKYSGWCMECRQVGDAGRCGICALSYRSWCTPFNNNFFETRGKTWATTRNWKTVNNVVELLK
jgi:uncharacterized protein (DUF1697 family)